MIENKASRETIDSLINNAMSTILNSELLLKRTEMIKSNLSSSNEIQNILLLFELLSGSLCALYEVCIDMKNMLSTDNLYIKRFHMQMINLSQCELCVFLLGNDELGVLHRLFNCPDYSSKGYKKIEEIQKYVKLLSAQCDVKLRNITAHYDKPDKMYSMLITLNSEDIYAKRIGDQISIHNNIVKFISPIIQIFTEKLSLNNIEKCEVQSILNDKVSDAFHKKAKLEMIISEQIFNAWRNIELHKKTYTICEKLIGYCNDMQIEYSRFAEILSLEELRWEISFLRYDLICSMNSYLKASTNIERSICLMRVYRIETSALTHLYGYNKSKNLKSIWTKVKTIQEFKSIPLSIQIEEELKSLTSSLYSYKRNLYTHYRDSKKLNISEKWQLANNMLHPNELIDIQRLLQLCKNINQFILLLISSINSVEKQRNEEILTPIRKFQELARRNNQEEIVDLLDKSLSSIYL